MVVEKGLVISVFQKDYELLSWNEQGEITQIEGMLTITFLVVSSCFHKDSWKQLYLIIKIPYRVYMSYEKEKRFMPVNLDEYAELKKFKKELSEIVAVCQLCLEKYLEETKKDENERMKIKRKW